MPTESSVTHGMIDNGGETSTTRFYLPQLTAANFAAVAGNGITESVGKLRLALATITNCNFTKHTVKAIVYGEAGTIPADKTVHREQKALFTCVDLVTTKKFTFTVPAPDLATIGTTGTDVLDIVGNATLAAFVAEVEAEAVSADGNAFSILSARTVGRNI